jgi:hypothetical protein
MATSAQLVEKALEVSRKRRRALEQLREAVRAGDRDQVFSLARKLVGVTDEKRHRINKSIN